MIKIYYSHTPFWRAEVLRVALFISDIPFEDIRITRDEFIGKFPNNKTLRIFGSIFNRFLNILGMLVQMDCYL